MTSSNQQLSELFGAPSPQLSTIHDLLTTAPKSNAKEISIACLHQNPSLLSSLSQTDPSKSEYLRWTYSELQRASHVLAIAFAANGIQPGDLILAYVTSGIEFHISVRAALELNRPFAPLNPKTTGNKKETEHYFKALKPAVVVVTDGDVARSLLKAEVRGLDRAKVLLVCSGGAKGERWRDLLGFVESSKEKTGALEGLQIKRRMDDVVLIVFTSGTTSLSKGAPYTNTSWSSSILSATEALRIDNSRVSCRQAPLFHLFRMGYWVRYHVAGGKVVHPSAWFDAGACLAAIRKERITDIPGVPAMINAILSHPDFKTTDTSSLKYAAMAATSIIPEHMRLCTEELKAEKVVNAYGLTETGLAFVGPPDQVSDDCYPLAGSLVCICDPETGEVLPRGEAAELHHGGRSVIKGYWVSSDVDVETASACFYGDEHGHWMKTGDQAVMSADTGEISIVGRYKDLIIRGGENIAPTAIESILAKDFGITAEVVGIPDEIAGELPVAVVKVDEEQNIDLPQVREKITEDLGRAFVLEDIIPLKELGADDFPKTGSGKVKKNELREKVEKHYQEQKAVGGNHNNNEISETLLSLWKQILGISALSLDNSVHVNGNTTAYETTKQLSQELLKPLGLSWDDVEDVIPMYNYIQRMLKRYRPQSQNHRHAWLCRNHTLEEVKAGLEVALTHHPTLHSMIIKPEDHPPLHLITHPTQKFFSHCVRIIDLVLNSDALDNWNYNNEVESISPCASGLGRI